MRINFSDNIDVSGRQLHLQTHLTEDGLGRIHTLFDGGRVLRQLSLRQFQSETDIESMTRSAHEDALSEITLLYQISVRIKTVRHAPSLLAQGRLFMKWRLLDEAISELTLARTIAPKQGDIALALAEAYRLRGGLNEAMELLLHGSQDGLERADFYCLQGQIETEQKQWRAAQSSFVKALKLQPDHTESFLCSAVGYLHSLAGAGDAHKKVRLLEKAREQVGRAIHSSAKPIEEAENVLRLLHQNKSEKALSQLELLLEKRPWALPMHRYDRFYLDYLYGEKGRDAQRVQTYIHDLESAVHHYPPNADLHNRLGVAYLLHSRQLISQSIHEFQQALKINPALSRAKRNLQLVKNDAKGFLILLRALLK